MVQKPVTPSKDNNLSYSELRAHLDETMAKLQAPDCDVDEAVELYEQALGYVTQLETHLQTAENRIKKVKANFELETGA